MKMPEYVRQNRAITATIKYGMAMQKINAEKLAKAIGEDKTTIYEHMKHPDKFRLSELRLISAKLDIPIEKLVKGEI